MIFVVTGAAGILYELLAMRLGWRLISHFTGPARVLRDTWVLALWTHFLIESKK